MSVKRAFLASEFSTLVVQQTDGSILTDARGKRYVAFVVGCIRVTRPSLGKSAGTVQVPRNACVRGLVIGVDFENEDYAARVQTKCRHNGLLVPLRKPRCFCCPLSAQINGRSTGLKR